MTPLLAKMSAWTTLAIFPLNSICTPPSGVFIMLIVSPPNVFTGPVVTSDDNILEPEITCLEMMASFSSGVSFSIFGFYENVLKLMKVHLSFDFFYVFNNWSILRFNTQTNAVTKAFIQIVAR